MRHVSRRAINVRNTERPARAQHRVAFGQTDAGRSQYRRVVGAHDIDDDAARRAVRAGDGEAVGVGRSGRKLILRRTGGVAPCPGCIDAETAVSTRLIGLRHVSRRVINVRDGERAEGGEYRVAFRQADRGRGQHRRIVGAGYGDGNCG